MNNIQIQKWLLTLILVSITVNAYSIIPERLKNVFQVCPRIVKLSAENLDFVWYLEKEDRPFILQLESACYPGLMETQQVSILEDWVYRGHILWIMFNPLRHELAHNTDWATHFKVNTFLCDRSEVINKKDSCILDSPITKNVEYLQLGTPNVSPAYYAFKGNLYPILKDKEGRIVFGIMDFGDGKIIFDGFGWIFFEVEKDWIDPMVYDGFIFWKNFLRWADACVSSRKIKVASIIKEDEVCQKIRIMLRNEFPDIKTEVIPCPTGGCIIRLGRVLFDTGKAFLRKEGKQLLNKLIPILKAYSNYFIKVEGHADPRPIRGRLKRIYPDNWALSKARAKSVRDYLIKVGHISKERIMLKWYGATKPIAPNTTPEGMQKNRRVEIILVPNKPK